MCHVEGVKPYKQMILKYKAMENVLLSISGGKGCGLHHCGIWAQEALDYDPLKE